jgi:hypothetical protein
MNKIICVNPPRIVKAILKLFMRKSAKEQQK